MQIYSIIGAYGFLYQGTTISKSTYNLSYDDFQACTEYQITFFYNGSGVNFQFVVGFIQGGWILHKAEMVHSGVSTWVIGGELAGKLMFDISESGSDWRQVCFKFTTPNLALVYVGAYIGIEFLDVVGKVVYVDDFSLEKCFDDNLIVNGGFEVFDSVWKGGTTTNSASYTDYQSRLIFGSGVQLWQSVALSSGTYYFSVMYLSDVGHQNLIIAFDTVLAGITERLIISNGAITEQTSAITGSSLSAFGSWINIAFNIYLGTSAMYYLSFFNGNGYIDDVWLATTGAIVYYSTVILNSPASGSSQTSLNVNFTYTPIMNNTIINASLWLNAYSSWQNVANTSTVSNGTLNNFTYTLPYQGVYFWNVQVWDSANYFFAPSNYTLTISGITADYGVYFDPCESYTTWTSYGSDQLNYSVDNSDFMEGFGSMNISAQNITGTAIHEDLNMTYSPSTNHVLGFYVKFDYNASDSQLSYIYINYDVPTSDQGTRLHNNGTHFILSVWWWTGEYDYSNYIAIDPNSWYWVEVDFLGHQWIKCWVDGVEVLNTTSVAHGIPSMNDFYVAQYKFSSIKFDAIRLSNQTGFPPVLSYSVDVVSDPEVNAYFSMSTNQTVLTSEVLAVSYIVNQTFSDLGHVGTEPWLDTQDDNSSYVQTNLVNPASDIYYVFNDTTLQTIETAVLHVRLAEFPVSTVTGVWVEVYFYDLATTSWIGIGGFSHFGDWETMNYTISQSKGFTTPSDFTDLSMKITMHLNQQPGGYVGRCTAIWIDLYGYSNVSGYSVHQTPYSFNPVSSTYVFTALNSTIINLGDTYEFRGFTYGTTTYTGETLILTSLSGVTTITLNYELVTPEIFLVPFMFLFWVIGLICMVISPLIAIDKVKKHEYLDGLVTGVIFGAIGFALFVAGLWGVTI